MKSRYQKSLKSPKNPKSLQSRKIVSTTEETCSKYPDKNGKLLLELQITESLCTDMSKTTRMSGINENTNEPKGHVEVTIVRPRPAIATTESNASRAGSRSVKILGRIEEQVGNRANKNISCVSKLNVATPESFCDNRHQWQSNHPNWSFIENKEDNELKCERVEHHPVYLNQTTLASVKTTSGSAKAASVSAKTVSASTKTTSASAQSTLPSISAKKASGSAESASESSKTTSGSAQSHSYSVSAKKASGSAEAASESAKTTSGSAQSASESAKSASDSAQSAPTSAKIASGLAQSASTETASAPAKNVSESTRSASGLASSSAKSACSPVLDTSSENVSNRRRGPLVELEALHKLLDRLRPNDLESMSAWYSSESCCREIVLRFRNLLHEWSSDRKRLDDCLATNDCLTKCEHCGVIRCVEIPRKRESILEIKNSERIINAEREMDTRSKIPANPLVRSTKKSIEIMRNSYPVVPLRCKSDAVAQRAKFPLGKINSNPVAKKTATKGTNDNKIVNQSCDKAITKNRKINKSDESSEFKRGDVSRNIDTFVYGGKYHKSCQEKSHPLMETVKYLARGNLDFVKKDKSQDSLVLNSPNDMEPSYFRKPYDGQRKNSFALHGSRDVDFQHDPYFFLCDRLGLCNDEANTDFGAKREEIKSKTGNQESSQDAASLLEHNDVQLKESCTSSFSSSSAENMIRRWIKPSKNVAEANVKRIRDTAREDLDAGPSLRNLQSIRARITDAIQKFANRSDSSSLYGQPNALRNQKKHSVNSNDVSMIKPANNTDTIDNRNKNFMGSRSNSALSVMSSRNLENRRLTVETSERFERQILYDQISSRDTISEDSIRAAGSKILLMYRKILESNEEMDWETFEKLVSALHPSQRELWCDICKAVSAEAKRVADETGATTEVCIEINPLPCKSDKPRIHSRGNEITFELDMIVRDVQALLKSNDVSEFSKRGNKEKKSIESNQN